MSNSVNAAAAMGDGLKAKGSNALQGLERWLGKKSAFGIKRRVSLYRRLAKFAKRGTTVQDSITGMWQRFDNRKAMERHVFRDMYLRLDGGEAVSRVFGTYVSDMEQVLIQAGENSGSLATGFEMAATLTDGMREMRGVIWRKLAEPAMLIVMLCAILVVTTYYVVPPLEGIDPNVAQWPLPARWLHNIAFFVRNGGPFVLVGLIGLVFLLRWALPNWTGRGRHFCDRWVPPFTFYRASANAGFLLAMAELTRNGTAISDAVLMMAEVSSPWLRRHLMRMFDRLDAGVEPGKGIDVGFLSRDTMDDVDDYIKGGSFTDALASLGEDAVEDGVTRVSRAAGTIFLVSILSVGFVVSLMSVGPMTLAAHKMKQSQSGMFNSGNR